MSNTWVVDLRHYLNENGAIEIPLSPGLRLPEQFDAAPYWVGLLPK